MSTKADVVVIGAGFYGARIALALKRAGAESVIILDRDDGLMRRASFANQARIHNGYHYPRSIATASSARTNFRRFTEDYGFAIDSGTQMLYAIARDSKISAEQFARFCASIGARCDIAPLVSSRLFDSSTVEAVFAVDELSFNTTAIARQIAGQLLKSGIECRFQSPARIATHNADEVIVAIPNETITARYVINCTYAALDGIGVEITHVIKRELAELALLRPPSALAGLAVTVMDGPFFSAMPFPALGCYSLSHVRYTPHAAWVGSGECESTQSSRAELMTRDAARFLPSLATAQYLGSLFEVKAILESSEGTDARPILFEVSAASKRVISVLGAKIDNIYDVEELLLQQNWAI